MMPPTFEDATSHLSEAQQSALTTLAMCTDHDARSSVEHWIRAWDKALGRGDTIEMQRRIVAARTVFGPYIYEQGAGI